MGFIQRIKNYFSPQEQIIDHTQDDLFKVRYQAFRRLLAANNACLDIMTELESAAQGHRHFGMHFLRSRVTSITAKVFTIVENLLSLAPDKYVGLRQSLTMIQEAMQQEMLLRQIDRSSAFILDLAQITAQDEGDVGGKSANLGELRNTLSLPVPDGFAITAHAYTEFMRAHGLWDEINRQVLAHPMANYILKPDQEDPHPPDEDEEGNRSIALLELCARIRKMILASPLPPELEAEIYAAYDRLCQREGAQVNVALRSSALGEDGAGTSFAGQHKSLLNLDRESLIEGYKEIVASKYSAHAMTYRYVRGIRDDEVLMCVGCLSMVESRAGGVAYTQNPLNHDDDRVQITSAWGMAKGVVDGTGTADHFAVARTPQLQIDVRDIPQKTECLICSDVEGVCRISVDPELCEAPTLNDQEILELAAMTLRVEAHYGTAQDIEWTFSPKGQLFLLQARPLELRSAPKNPELIPGHLPVVQGGTTASSGTALGVVHIVRKDVDILMIPEDAILVCVEASPKWAAVLARSQGIITEQGSAAGHLANVAREFGVPALFGVPEITRQLQDAQKISLDADNCVVYAGHVEELLERKPERPNMMQGSAVYQTLLNVNKHITPLNLINPEGLDFTPSNCKTLHDITRFCHEKAVVEMFSFGRDHQFSPRSSKQLKTQTTMNWWIINLEDGFHKDTTDNTVSLANIASIPMLALWRGIVAFPWDGPPGLDGKGFLAVLFQSTTNTNLEPAMASSYAEKNYFMISKHFCNLQSRFGYHFTSVEALAGPRPRENYIRFQFKGGAADYARRERRARFVGEILDEFNFQTKVREDAMFARVDDCEQQFIEDHLEIIGHLLIHTRQLDMIMSKEDMVQFYKNKLIKQIRVLLAEKNR